VYISWRHNWQKFDKQLQKIQMSIKHNDISLFVLNEEDNSPELDRAIRELLVVCFPADREYFQRQSWWHCVPVYRVLGKMVKVP
jgi:hypothetical protein